MNKEKKNNTVAYSLRNYKLHLILGPLFKSFEVIFELFVPFLVKYIVDIGLPNAEKGDYNGIIIPGITIFVMCIFCFCSTSVCQYLSSKCSQGFGTDLRNRIFNKISTLSLNEIEKVGRGNLVTLVSNDTNRLQLGVANLIRLVVRAPVLVLGSLIMTIFISIDAFIVFLISIIIISIPVSIIFYFSSRQIIKVQKNNDRISNICNDDLNGIRVIRSFNKEEVEINKFNSLTNSYYKEAKTNQLLNSLISPVIYLVLNIAAILIVLLGKETIFSNVSLSSGSLIALIQYLNQITTALIVLFNIIVVFTKANSSRERVNAFLTMESSIKNGDITKLKKDYNVLLSFNNVSFKYENGDNYVIKDINFDIKKGEKVGIIGGTGSGKTTIIKLLERYYDCNEGSILFKDYNVKDLDINVLRDDISLVTQKVSIFNGTIKENIQMGNEKINDEEIIQSLKEADAYSFVFNFKENVEYKIVEGGKNLSGGQKQRISIARALAKDNDLLVLDDSTSALDFLTDKNIRNTIFSKKDLSTIIVSQRATSLKDCDKIIVIDKGKVSGIGTHEDLLKNNIIYKEIYESQVNL